MHTILDERDCDTAPVDMVLALKEALECLRWDAWVLERQAGEFAKMGDEERWKDVLGRKARLDAVCVELEGKNGKALPTVRSVALGVKS